MFKSINGGILPQRATKFSAGFDVFANEDVVVGAGETKLIGLGVALDLEMYCFDNVSRLPYNYVVENNVQDWNTFLQSHYFALHIRSSLRAKGLTSLGTGIIDMDFIPHCKIGKALNNGHCEHFKKKLKE